MNKMIQRLFDNESPSAMLAFAPFFLLLTSYETGFNLALTAAVQLLIVTLMLFCLRNLIPADMRIPIVIIISVTVMLISRMVLNAEAYSFIAVFGLLFPLLMVNSLVLSLGITVLSSQQYKAIVLRLFVMVIAFFLLFISYGWLKTFFSTISISSSPAGCFFVAAVLFSIINFLKSNTRTD
jgi:Na+-translocating ferredoxin:NAD+ oxidoreductase RnfE subunit